jgi:peptide/nickel transport system permease protein
MAVAAVNLAHASRRLGGVFLIAFLGAALVFFVMRAGHGDPALSALGDQATPEAIRAFHEKWGLDAPLPVQFWRWLSGALVGNFGTSMTVAGGVPISALIGSRLPNTLFVGLYALSIADHRCATRISVLHA